MTQVVAAKVLPVGYKLYRQSFVPFKGTTDWRDETWFALTPSYGESYGSYASCFDVRRKLVLLNLGRWSTRHHIMHVASEQLSPSEAQRFTSLFHPDHQWGGAPRANQ